MVIQGLSATSPHANSYVAKCRDKVVPKSDEKGQHQCLEDVNAGEVHVDGAILMFGQILIKILVPALSPNRSKLMSS